MSKTMEKKPDATTGKSNTVEDNLTLRDDHIYPPSAVAAAAATAAMKTLENTTNAVNNASSFPLNSKEQDHSRTAAMNNYNMIYAAINIPPHHHREPTHRDVILNDWDYGNPKFHKWIQEHREAFSLATSLSAQTILIQGLIQRVKKQKGKFLERTQNHQGYDWVELADDAVTLGVAKALRSPSQSSQQHGDPNSVHRVSRPASPIRNMTSDQLQFASVMCMYSTPLWSYHAPIYDAVPSGNTSQARKAAPTTVAAWPIPQRQAPATSKKKTMTTAGSALPKAAKSKNGTNTTTTTTTTAKAADKKRNPPTGAASADGVPAVKKRRMPARQIANSNDISPDAIASCVNNTDPEMALEAYKILQSIEVQSLPRGVTARPSGKWQAQFYFDGKSRYIGVFDSAKAAAQAYECVHRLLAKSRPGCGHTTTRRHSLGFASIPADVDPVHAEATRALFERARDAALGAVASLNAPPPNMKV